MPQTNFHSHERFISEWLVFCPQRTKYNYHTNSLGIAIPGSRTLISCKLRWMQNTAWH